MENQAPPLKQEPLICPCCKRELTGTRCPFDRYYLVSNAAYKNASDDENLGTEIGGKYGLIDKLGAGGMGAVYKAVDSKKKVVAIKILRNQYAKHTAIRERFIREAEAGATLTHPNVVPLVDFGREKDGRLWLAMEYVKGWTLRDEINHNGGFKVSEAINLCKQILSGLAAAHDAGMIHRDLKHDNIMYYGRRDQFIARIVDFGVVKSEVADLESEQSLDEILANLKIGENQASSEDAQATDDQLSNKVLTADGMLVGSPSYMSPEQIKGLKVGPPADLYALAVVIYEVLTAKRLFSVNDYETLLRAGAQREAPLLVFSALGELIPEAFALLIDKALAQDPADRFPDAHTMLLALNQIEKKANTLPLELLSFLPKKAVVQNSLLKDEDQAKTQAEDAHHKNAQKQREALAETLEIVQNSISEQVKVAEQERLTASKSQIHPYPQIQQKTAVLPSSALDWMIWFIPVLFALVTWFIIK